MSRGSSLLDPGLDRWTARRSPRILRAAACRPLIHPILDSVVTDEQREGRISF